MTEQPTAAMLVIGDEILSGRTRDINAHHLAQRLEPLGIVLREVRFVGDDPAGIGRAVRALASETDHLFTSGGIGPTHDDLTADAVALALGAELEVHPEARARLAAHYTARDIALNAARLRMARIPQGATLIDNPISAAPGFSLGNVHVLAGVPKIFAAMLDGLLPRLAHGTPPRSLTREIAQPEGEIAADLAELAAAHPALSIGCYPWERQGQFGVTLVLRSHDAAALQAADAALCRLAP